MRRRQRGFTLIELVIVITVIAILAALLAPTILGQVEKSRMAVEKRSIGELAKIFNRFHSETGGWPYLGGAWRASDPIAAASGGVDPTRFNAGDTALHRTIGLPQCSPLNLDNACWGGPYVSAGSSMADVNMRDPWGNTRMFAIIPPVPLGGSVPGAPNGAVIIWSTGPDGLDQTGCTTGGCTWNKEATARGQSSTGPSDDIVVVVGASY